MPSWSLLSGAPRLGDAPSSGLPGSSGASLVRHARVAAFVGGAALVWGLAGLVAFLFAGRVDPNAVAVVGLAPAALLAAVLFVLHRGAPERRALFVASAAFATLALVLAVAGHVLHPRGQGMAWLLPPALLGDGGETAGILVALGACVLVPLLAAARVRALAWTFDASGRHGGSLRLLSRALRVPVTPHAPPPTLRQLPLALARRLGEAWLLPGALALDVAGTLARRALDLSARRVTDRVHADVELDALAEALAGAGAECEADGGRLVVRLPPAVDGAPGAALTVKRGGVAFPRVEACHVLEVQGPVVEARRFRRLLEGPLGHVAVFSWSAPARRLERRLNALHREAQVAGTVEERSFILEEAERMQKLLAERDLNEEERAILLTWKGEALRALIATRMLAEPVGPRSERTLAPLPAMAPPLGALMEAGGLASMRRLVFVPVWILPVSTAWGEQEIALAATTGKPGANAGRALLDAMRRRGPGFLLDAGRHAQFIPPPRASAALLRTLREELRIAPTPAQLQAVEVVYVPHVATDAGYVNALTGEPAPDLGPAPGVVRALG